MSEGGTIIPPIVDVHSHIVPSSLPVDPSGGKISNWPCLTCSAGKAAMTIGGKLYREFDDRNWSIARRIDHMDAQNIEIQALSPLPELLSFWIDASAAKVMCDHVNGAIANMVAERPDRFVGLGMVPLQDVGLAIKQAQRLKEEFGFPGIEIGSNIDGVSPANPKFDAFYEAAADLDLSIFVHGLKPAAPERFVGPDVMPAIIGVPLDTAIAISSYIASGLLERYPTLRLLFSHGGGAIGAVIDRFQHVWNLMPALQESKAPLETARRLFFDIMTFDAEYSSHIIDKIGPQSFVVGTDYPAGGMGLMNPSEFLSSLSVGEKQIADIARHNGLKFLGIAN
jgi:aminocarboxymuconate-semialdehyde decarboxylase